MASGNFVLDKGYDAAAAITKFTGVKFSAAQTVTPVTASTDTCVGIAQYGVTAAEILQGKGASVRMTGISELECSETVAIGKLVSLGTDAKGKVAQKGDSIIGMCTLAGASGTRCSVKLDFSWSIAVAPGATGATGATGPA